MRKLVKYSMLIVTLLLSGLLCLTFYIPRLNPYNFNYMSLLTLLTPGLVALNIFLFFFWAIARKYLIMLIPIASLLISWPVYSVVMAANLRPTVLPIHGNNFSIMSYNVRLLDLYGWSKNKQTRANLIAYLKEKNPSILCLQEFYSTNDSAGFNNIKAIKEACKYEYHAECNMFVSKRGKWGNIVFSHYPIVEAENLEIDVNGSNLLQKTLVAIQDDTIALYNLHLKSNRFSKSESELVNQHKLPEINNTNWATTKAILQKLMDNSVNRGLEADIIASLIDQSPYPVVLCGDLNDLPSSYIYFKIRGDLRDAFLDKGCGLGKTYRNTIPVIRIDYLFYQKSLTLQGFERPEIIFSDHHPIIGYFALKPGKKTSTKH